MLVRGVQGPERLLILVDVLVGEGTLRQGVIDQFGPANNITVCWYWLVERRCFLSELASLITIRAVFARYLLTFLARFTRLIVEAQIFLVRCHSPQIELKPVIAIV